MILEENEMTELWFEQAIRSHAEKHGPDGEAWNISMILDVLRKAYGADQLAMLERRIKNLRGSVTEN